ncbi:MAG: GNAT family N-acetyltransferase, partial [Bacteroidales bacterium]
MQEIIPPIDRKLLKKELTKDLFMRKTNFAERELYIITAHNAPAVMQEIGRLREYTFRQAGGGTGKSCDIDEFDTMENPYKQLVVWDPQSEEIIGGYRFIEGKNIQIVNGNPLLSTGEIFDFSENFIQNYLPHTIELGRSFIQTKFQSTKEARKGMYSLDNLWDGLGAICVQHPEIIYFFGKITMYRDFPLEARDYILFYLQTFFPDPDHLVIPRNPLQLVTNRQILEDTFKGLDLETAFKTLNKSIRKLGENIPPLFSAYTKLSPTMRCFGTAINDHFGDVEETGILITIADIYPDKKERH